MNTKRFICLALATLLALLPLTTLAAGEKYVKNTGKEPVGKYSLGMRQRLGIAQAIMEDPSLLILDEPMNGLDKNGVAEMRELFRSLATDGRTILLASHNIADIDALCDTVCEMDAGVMTMIREERA